ncbi:hypothetical protein NPIL_305961 [Nephila pilipes]|uniref:Uncharacterized protein n=1 Tax=Nephila pilipes TaxID=299642 RepID=A0A8X6T9B8_NEPPI|nr:hypothetical protein NPIL_305961 [Nephila pilipes]
MLKINGNAGIRKEEGKQLAKRQNSAFGKTYANMTGLRLLEETRIFEGERTEPCYTLPHPLKSPHVAEALAMPIRRRVADDISPVSGQGAVSGPPARNK